MILKKVGARWRVPTWHARQRLEEAGIKIIPVPMPDEQGVRLSDLLLYEETIREKEKAQAQADRIVAEALAEEGRQADERYAS